MKAVKPITLSLGFVTHKVKSGQELPEGTPATLVAQLVAAGAVAEGKDVESDEQA